jgi:hypothetical protein
VGIAEKRGKTRRAIKARQAQPVDGAIASDQGNRLAIADDRIIFDTAGHKTSWDGEREKVEDSRQLPIGAAAPLNDNIAQGLQRKQSDDLRNKRCWMQTIDRSQESTEARDPQPFDRMEGFKTGRSKESTHAQSRDPIAARRRGRQALHRFGWVISRFPAARGLGRHSPSSSPKKTIPEATAARLHNSLIAALTGMTAS